MLSWFRECVGRGCQFWNVMLSSSPGSTKGSLTDHFEELRRKIKAKYGLDIEYFKVETLEGHGVLHIVFAIVSDQPVWIGQRWLSKQWGKIHAAPVVWIEKIKHGQVHRRRISKYFVAQYFAGQSAYVRHSYSWWKCKFALQKNWRVLVRAINCGYNALVQWEPLDQAYRVTFQDALYTWGLFLDGSAGEMLGGKLYVMRDRRLECLF